MSVTAELIRVYSFEFIQHLHSSFDAVLDEDIVNRLLDIKRNNRFVRCKSPMRLKYKIRDSVAQQWRKEREESASQSPLEKYESAVQSNLNKISPKNYSVILEKIIESYDAFVSSGDESASSEKGLEVLVDSLFEKASKEKTYSELYAQLVGDIYKKGYEHVGQYSRNKAEQLYTSSVQTRIQDCRADMDEEEIRNVFKTKMKFTGLFLFIANMFVQHMITYQEVKQYYDGLLNYFDIAPLEYCDSYIESICQMIRLAGYSLEKSAESKDTFYNDFMKVLYDYQVVKSSDNPKMTNKNRFAIMDVTDLYKRGWDMNRYEEDASSSESFASVKETMHKKKSRK